MSNVSCSPTSVAPPPGTPSNANDRLPFPSELAPFSRRAPRDARTHSGRWADDAALLQAALLSLPLTRDARSADDAAATRAAVGWLRETAAAEFTTSLQRDEELLRLHAKGLLDGSPAAESRATGDDRWVVALHYRIQQRLWRLAEEVSRRIGRAGEGRRGARRLMRERPDESATPYYLCVPA